MAGISSQAAVIAGKVKGKAAAITHKVNAEAAEFSGAVGNLDTAGANLKASDLFLRVRVSAKRKEGAVAAAAERSSYKSRKIQDYPTVSTGSNFVPTHLSYVGDVAVPLYTTGNHVPLSQDRAGRAAAAKVLGSYLASAGTATRTARKSFGRAWDLTDHVSLGNMGTQTFFDRKSVFLSHGGEPGSGTRTKAQVMHKLSKVRHSENKRRIRDGAMQFDKMDWQAVEELGVSVL